MTKCALPECDNEAKVKYCSEQHGRRARQRTTPPEPVPVEADELRAALRRSQANFAKAKAKTEELVDAVYTAAKDAALLLGPVPAIPSPRLKNSGKLEYALIHTTDWQLGKETSSYNMAKCGERLDLLAEKVIMLTDVQRSEHPVNHAVVMFGGDIVEGLNIFPGQAWEVEANLFEQVFTAARYAEKFLRRMLANFNEVIVYAEEGNHGRLGRRGDWPRTDNTDMMVYEIARLALKDESRLVWVPRKSWYQLVEIGNYRAMLIHGDEIKSFGGQTPAYGLLKKGTAWSSGVTEAFRDIYFGHFHTPMALTLPNGGTMFGTGSTESDNAYAAEFVAAKGQPSQRLHFVDPRKGRVTAEYKIYLDDEAASKD